MTYNMLRNESERTCQEKCKHCESKELKFTKEELIGKFKMRAFFCVKCKASYIKQVTE